MKSINKYVFFISCMTILVPVDTATAQNKSQLVRLAKLVIDSTQLENYKAVLKEAIETALRTEPGVLTLYAVSEKVRPTHFTILEIYADSVAYRAHLHSAHFLKYKTSTKDMVKSLELVDTTPLIPDSKVKPDNAGAKKKLNKR